MDSSSIYRRDVRESIGSHQIIGGENSQRLAE